MNNSSKRTSRATITGRIHQPKHAQPSWIDNLIRLFSRGQDWRDRTLTPKQKRIDAQFRKQMKLNWSFYHRIAFCRKIQRAVYKDERYWNLRMSLPGGTRFQARIEKAKRTPIMKLAPRHVINLNFPSQLRILKKILVNTLTQSAYINRLFGLNKFDKADFVYHPNVIRRDIHEYRKDQQLAIKHSEETADAIDQIKMTTQKYILPDTNSANYHTVGIIHAKSLNSLKHKAYRLHANAVLGTSINSNGYLGTAVKHRKGVGQ